MKNMKLWEKIFFIANIIIIVSIIGIYAYRTIHYYRLTHAKPADNKLISAILTNDNIVYKDDGLYQDSSNNTYYYKGTNVTNYVWYSGRLWRIISIDNDSIKLITDSNQSTLVWGQTNIYEESYIKAWLENNFLNSLLLKDNLISSNWCNSPVDINNYNCENTIDSNIGLLSTKEYLKAGGINSFLNNNSYWWTINTSEDNKVWYIHDNGGLNDNSFEGDTYYSYGIRPVINISIDTSVIEGNGSSTSPYIINEVGKVIISENSIGSYVTLNNYTWRIMDITDDYVKIIMDGYVKENEENVKVSYNNLSSYLNNFLASFNKDNLKKCDFYIEKYSDNYNYKYNNSSRENIKSYIGIASIGDLFINDYGESWLYNTIDESALMYTATNNGSIYADMKTNTNYVRPIICIDKEMVISKGKGTLDNPLVLGEI